MYEFAKSDESVNGFSPPDMAAKDPLLFTKVRRPYFPFSPSRTSLLTKRDVHEFRRYTAGGVFCGKSFALILAAEATRGQHVVCSKYNGTRDSYIQMCLCVKRKIYTHIHSGKNQLKDIFYKLCGYIFVFN